MAVGGDGGDDDDNSESTLANNSKRSSNRAGAGNDLPDGATSKFVPNNANQFKIRSKILNDFLEAHANDQMSLTDPLSQQHNQNKSIIYLLSSYSREAKKKQNISLFKLI